MLNHGMRAMICLWAHTDLGMDAFMWWAYNNEDKGLRGQLMEIASLPLHGAQPIKLYDHDGEDDVILNTPGKLMTRAFIEGDLVTIYAINMAKYADRATIRAYQDYSFGINDAIISGDIKYSQWTGVESNAKSFTVVSNQKITGTDNTDNFAIDLPVRSITCIQFKTN